MPTLVRLASSSLLGSGERLLHLWIREHLVVVELLKAGRQPLGPNWRTTGPEGHHGQPGLGPALLDPAGLGFLLDQGDFLRPRERLVGDLQIAHAALDRVVEERLLVERLAP